MRLALCQLNPVVGDLAGNRARIAAAYDDAVAAGADLVCTTELALTGYPPEDLVLKGAFVAAAHAELAALAAHTGTAPLIVGTVEVTDTETAATADVPATPGGRTPLANSAIVCRDGAIGPAYRKQRLPNYGVFDEVRYFQPGTEPLVVDVAGTRVGVTICEDLWGSGGPVAAAADAGATIVVNLNASPYAREKRDLREHWARHHARSHLVWLAYVNQVGGQDELVFDGDSFVMGPDGTVLARGTQMSEATVVVDLPAERGAVDGAVVAADDAARLDPVAEVYAALVLGTRDYVTKNGFPGALVSVSGGIDSALVATIAVDALGADRVTCVGLPSPHSSAGSVDDARALVANLGATWLKIPIGGVMTAFEEALAEPFAGTEPGVAEENLQSRIRGTLMMALSNKRGDILLSAGNKSEYAVGYATLYGDMAGGFAVAKDVPKLLVYALARHRNAVAGRELIPEATLTKPPSAELRPDQVDTDSLPDYDVLDPIVEGYVERDESAAALVAAGFDAEVVAHVTRLIDRAEYKRRQAAPGVKITPRAFGKDRRLPITQRWSG